MDLTLEAEAKSPRTVENYRSSLDLFVRWLIDTDRRMAPEDVTPALAREWLVELINTRSARALRISARL